MQLFSRTAGVQARLLFGSLYHGWELRRAKTYRLLRVEIRIEPEITLETSVLLERLEQALALIRRTDPWQYEYMTRRVNCILVKRGPGAQYWPDSNVCVLEPASLVRRSRAITALSLIHELAHARISQRVPVHVQVTTGRFERLCVRSQIRFARRLAAAGWDVEDVIQHYQTELEAIE